MSCNYNPSFKWSRTGGNLSDIHEWRLTLDDFRNKEYTWYWNNIPIKNINTPYLDGRDYITTIVLIDDTFSSRYVRADDIYGIQDMRHAKLEQLL